MRYSYTEEGWLSTITDAEGKVTRFTYDLTGSLISEDYAGELHRENSYNELGLLESWTDGEYSESYSYNAEGLLSSISNAEGSTNLTWDILMGEGVVISAETNGVETYYTYGLERISAQTGKTRTEYVYDGRGSVTAEVSYNNAWYTLGGILSSKEVISKSYTPFGEQIGEASSGFGYNGEYYNAATGMVYLRARFYEPEMNRFSQKDVVRGSVVQPGSLNRYSYVQNDPVNFIDPSGQSLKSVWNSVKSAAKNAVTSVKNTVSKVATAVKNVFTGGSSSSSNTAAPSKPPASSTGTKSSAVYYSTTRSSTTSSAVAGSSQSSGTSRAYTPGPIQSTARNFNPNNIMQSTSQAIADARKAADYMNATAPGSPAARQATQAYMETVRLASMANSSNNPNIARQAYQTSQFSVNRVNNVATGSLPNTYTPYDSNGNPYSYFNSSRQTGKTPSPDAPRVEDVSGDDSAYCNSSSNDSKRVYDREAVAEYAAIYAGGNLQGINNMLEGFLGFLGIGRNDYYPSFQHNCTNFTSQAISAGGLPQDSDWYARWGWDDWLYSHSWSVASDQFNYITHSDYYNNSYEIVFMEKTESSIESEISYSIEKVNAQVGDLIYSYHLEEGKEKIYHSTVITKVDDAMIYYSGNTTRWYNKPLIDAFDPNATTKIVIVTLKDEYQKEGK